jgi:hypothetical protein
VRRAELTELRLFNFFFAPSAEDDLALGML